MHYQRRIYFLYALYIGFCLLYACADEKSQQAPSPSLVGREDKLEWFKEAKFGLFIHWGPYSRLAGEWNGKKIEPGRNAEWIMKFLQIPRDEYRLLAKEFNPVHFNARQWVDLAKRAGMKYLVITAKHHDGFAMYHSKVSEYNIVDWTPFDNDPLKALSEACREAGIRFCIYYSHREDWDEPYAYGNDWDFNFDPEQHPQLFEHQYLSVKAKPQLKELLTEYGPLGLVWFDRGMYTQQQGLEFVKTVQSLQPTCLINGRVGNYDKELLGDYQSMSDNGMPIGGIEEYWEAPQTMNTTWGYSKYDLNWKSAPEIIERLVRIVSAGGNYLLNIGPDGMGDIPEASIRILEGVGRWMDHYGNSIYRASASPFEPFEWGYCTVNGRQLYLHVFRIPEDSILHIRGLVTKVRQIYPMTEKHHLLNFQQGRELIDISWNQAITADPVNTVLVAVLDGDPEVLPPVIQQETDSITLDYLKAVTHGKAVKRYNRKGLFHISKFFTPDDLVSWNVSIVKPGEYQASISYAANPEWAGRFFVVSNGAQKIQAAVIDTDGWYNYKWYDIGTLQFQAPGTYTIHMQPETAAEDYLMYLRSLTLTGVNSRQ